MKTHEIARACGCGSTSMFIGKAWSVAGARIYPFVCSACWAVQTQYAKKAVALAEDAEGEGLPEVTTVTQSRADFEAQVQERRERKCEVCGKVGDIELHHWAPWHLFGAESERWPMSHLCQACHTRWHQIVTPDMGKKKGAGF